MREWARALGMRGAKAGRGETEGPPSERSGVVRREPRRGIAPKPPARGAPVNAVGTASGARTTSGAAPCVALLCSWVLGCVLCGVWFPSVGIVYSSWLCSQIVLFQKKKKRGEGEGETHTHKKSSHSAHNTKTKTKISTQKNVILPVVSPLNTLRVSERVSVSVCSLPQHQG